MVYPLRPCRAEKFIQQEGYLYSFKLDRLGRSNWSYIKQLGGFRQFAMKSRILVCVCGADGKKPRYNRVFTGTISRELDSQATRATQIFILPFQEVDTCLGIL